MITNMRVRCAGCNIPLLDMNSTFGQLIDMCITCSECGCVTVTTIGYIKKPELAIRKEKLDMPADQTAEIICHKINANARIIFFEVFDSLAKRSKSSDVDGAELIDNLKARVGVTGHDADGLIQIAIQEGAIYERRSGVYHKVSDK